ncbi:MAG: hypothetical protein II839_07355 [Kiritimatiellae bacterium]|nr:hypothetical protein [Kiritimatiellia bacterium]
MSEPDPPTFFNRIYAFFRHQYRALWLTIVLVFLFNLARHGIWMLNHKKEPVPATGTVWVFTDRPREVPFRMPALRHQDVYAKLTDAESGKDVLSCFVRRDETAEVLVPLGTYRLRYAHGTDWYGTNLLFGPETDYRQIEEPLVFAVDADDPGQVLVPELQIDRDRSRPWGKSNISGKEFR